MIFNPYQIYVLQKFFSYFGCRFTFLMAFFEVQPFFILMKHNLFYLMSFVLPMSHLRRLCTPSFQIFAMMISSNTIIVLGLTYNSVFLFEIIFMDRGKGSTSFFYIWMYSCPSTICCSHSLFNYLY